MSFLHSCVFVDPHFNYIFFLNWIIFFLKTSGLNEGMVNYIWSEHFGDQNVGLMLFVKKTETITVVICQFYEHILNIEEAHCVSFFCSLVVKFILFLVLLSSFLFLINH